MTAQFSSLPGIADFNCERAAISRTASVPSSPEEETGLKIWKTKLSRKLFTWCTKIFNESMSRGKTR